MGNHKHDILSPVFHKISHSEPERQLSPQHVGKVALGQLICGAHLQIRGEQPNCSVRTDLSFDGLGDGDHSSGHSLRLEGIFNSLKRTRFNRDTP